MLIYQDFPKMAFHYMEIKIGKIERWYLFTGAAFSFVTIKNETKLSASSGI